MFLELLAALSVLALFLHHRLFPFAFIVLLLLIVDVEQSDQVVEPCVLAAVENDPAGYLQRKPVNIAEQRANYSTVIHVENDGSELLVLEKLNSSICLKCSCLKS